MWLILPTVTIVGGVILTLMRTWEKGSPKWVLNALLLAGLASVAHGVLGLLLHQSLSVKILQVIGNFKTLAGGIVVGILVTLAIAGELSVRKLRKRQD